MAVCLVVVTLKAMGQVTVLECKEQGRLSAGPVKGLWLQAAFGTFPDRKVPVAYVATDPRQGGEGSCASTALGLG